MVALNMPCIVAANRCAVNDNQARRRPQQPVPVISASNLSRQRPIWASSSEPQKRAMVHGQRWPRAVIKSSLPLLAAVAAGTMTDNR